MSVIALQGIRGGVGTTSVTTALAWALQGLGESVLVVDFSPENLLRLHFNMPFEQPRGWAHAYLDNTPWQQGAMRYTPLLDFLPFGTTSASQKLELSAKSQQTPYFLQQNITQLVATGHYRWILLDLPAEDIWLAQQGVAIADKVLLLLNADANCSVRLYQQTLPKNCHFLINKYFPASQLQQDLHELWLLTLRNILPMLIHRDEALAETLAVKQPLGEYAPQSLAATDILTLASWCLLNRAETPV